MRRLFRWLGRAAAALALILLALLAPVAWVETACRGTATPAPHTALAAETRPAIRTLLTYPEWHIVHAYDDYARVISTGDPHDYRYLRSIGGFWSSLCTLTRESAALGQIDGDTRTMVHVIGVSFTAEMLMKAAYEETVGRLVTLIRGPTRAPLDDLSAEQAAAYARFLQQTPWYLYDFRADAAALRDAAGDSLRDRERAVALGLEHGARAAYAGVIESAVAATGQDDLTLQMVVTGLPDAALTAEPGVRILRRLDQGSEVETPRYRALTLILNDWARAGASFADIAGNDRIMFTALSDRASEDGALLSLPRQGEGDTRHLFLVPVTELAARLRALPGEGLTLEHIHDY